MIGTKLAHYEITTHLGTGGMGEVYEATDAKLGRSVAIKLLPEAFSHDGDRVARFEREARLLASLNHPNIATIYGVEESGGRKFLVMELVPGETLAYRLKLGPVPVDEALSIARQIADGLQSAHEKGVVHRDLKPANIKVTPQGQVKVLDFGLAKAFGGDAVFGVNPSNSPTLSMAATEAGVIMGTAAYMSPEQAKGKETDRASDIWAFGCVVYEVLTGQAAFTGETLEEINCVGLAGLASRWARLVVPMPRNPMTFAFPLTAARWRSLAWSGATAMCGWPKPRVMCSSHSRRTRRASSIRFGPPTVTALFSARPERVSSTSTKSPSTAPGQRPSCMNLLKARTALTGPPMAAGSCLRLRLPRRPGTYGFFR